MEGGKPFCFTFKNLRRAAGMRGLEQAKAGGRYANSSYLGKRGPNQRSLLGLQGYQHRLGRKGRALSSFSSSSFFHSSPPHPSSQLFGSRLSLPLSSGCRRHHLEKGLPKEEETVTTKFIFWNNMGNGKDGDRLFPFIWIFEKGGGQSVSSR